jgi:hypothetical protein
MKDRLRTLFLTANGLGSQVVFVDTVLRGMLRYNDGATPPAFLRHHRRVKQLFAELRDVYAQLSYIADWRDAFLQCPCLDVEVCNINNLVHFAQCALRVRSYDLIVISHAAAGDDMTLLKRLSRYLERRRGKIILFIGNEYDVLDDKLDFIRGMKVDYVCSQLPINSARYLYAGCEDSEIIEMPHALNPQHYYPMSSAERDVDVGFVGDLYWPFIGDRERTAIIEWFQRHGPSHGLICDIRLKRLSREDWNAFLNRSKAIVGAESGTYYLNECGKLLERARAYNLFENQDAGFDDVFDRFYRGQPRGVSGKAISSRHFEAIGAKTCQILVEGDYNGILAADVHYISVKKDMSNIDDAIERFRDEAYRAEVTSRSYDYVMSAHTYRHRVDSLVDRLS